MIIEKGNKQIFDDIATPDDIKAIEEGMKEFAEGKTIIYFKSKCCLCWKN